MKLTKLANLILLGAALTLTFTGCKKPKTPLTPLPTGHTPVHTTDSALTGQSPIGGDQSPIQVMPTPGSNGGGPTPTGGGALTGDHANWNANADLLKTSTIHFAFDKSSIRSDDKSKLDEVANYLKSNPNAAVRVEGNCDERGTEEYNRSLGERRALAAREYLVHAGIEASRVDTISYGFDRPVEPAHSEEAWSQNRRDDFVVLTAP